MKRLSILLFYFMHVFSSYAFHFVPGIDDSDEEIEGNFFIPIFVGDAAKDAFIHLIIYVAILGLCLFIISKTDDSTNNFINILRLILELACIVPLCLIFYYALKIWWIVLIIIVLIAIIGGIYSWIKGDFK